MHWNLLAALWLFNAALFGANVAFAVAGTGPVDGAVNAGVAAFQLFVVLEASS